jgi:hypothetical protein
VSRRSQKWIITINVRLQPGDIVYVPYTPYRMLAQLAEDVLDQFVRTVAVNQATYVVTGEDDRPVPITAPYGISTGVQPPPTVIQTR